MLSVRLGEEETLRRLPAQLSLAAVNAPEQCVVSGPEPAVAALERDLAAEGVSARRLRVSHANHSPMLDPVVPLLVAEARRVRLSPPRVPFVSGVTGDWATAVDATEARYWGRQLREPVRFAHGLRRVLQREDALLLEVGPGTTLTTLVRQQVAGRPVVPSMRRPDDPTPDRAALLSALGQLWQAGVAVDWTAFAAPEGRRRVPLPGHPLERRSHWLGRTPAAPADEPAQPSAPESAAGRGPTTTFERHLAGVWRDLIGVERIDRDDDFFELGGDSLLATMLAARLVEVFGVEVPLRSLFEGPTLAGMAGAIESVLLEHMDE
jgi:acyl transferase domain-containing protein